MNSLLQWALKSIGFDAELYFGNVYSEDNTTIPYAFRYPFDLIDVHAVFPNRRKTM